MLPHLLAISFIELCCEHGISFSSKTLSSSVSAQFIAQSWLALCDTMICSRQASLSITNSRSPPKPVSIESVMPSKHLILCHPLLMPSIFPNFRVFSNESAPHIRWPKYWSFSFNISPVPILLSHANILGGFHFQR